MPEAKEKTEKQEKPKEDPKVAVPKLINALRNATDQGEKRKLRSRLRALGHRGGIPDKPKKEFPKKKDKGESKGPVVKKGSRAAGAAVTA